MTAPILPRGEVHVAVFARAPVPGQAKTRLIRALGANGAARLHRQLVLKTLATAYESGIGPVTLWAAPDTSHRFFRALAKLGVRCRAQSSGDLGSRMRDALTATLPIPTLLIGSDCPALTPEHLRASADALIDGHDAVALPAEDGGYVLVGFSACAPRYLFEQMPWGSADVMAATRSRLTELDCTWAEPAVLWDIDRPADLERWRALCA